MRKVVAISDAELEIMKIIWKSPNITANKIIEKLKGKTEWKPNTIKTLINRLLNKGAIDFQKEGKEYYYYNLINEEEYKISESKSFLNKIFNGSLNLMLMNFIKTKNLSEKDIEELKKILNNAHK
ncbi:BlaI/MecI/CopY family transcriptional regulator [Clostridium kluyveri]|uniref:Transcriptional regulator n=1 Tax=Clostridium kluyveri (strain ATCC 8527 / DSM 555 / NBRC 12016 / NCIMB 10680 / K1) TaxID=431943 RepID=A5N577_CLOK5|nr:BlaI/MecI/CopY family transcriptional regulator [Clostridium kluyveri]EDK32458.1 Transcriptional regulator [Clostridium kluyveri DSM 555]